MTRSERWLFAEGAIALALAATIVMGAVVAARTHATPHLVILVLWLPSTACGIHLILSSRRTTLPSLRTWCRWTGWSGALALVWLFLASLLTGVAMR